MEKETKQTINLKNLEDRIKDFSEPLALYVKEESLQKLFTSLNSLYEVIQKGNKSHEHRIDQLYAKLKPVDDILISFGKLYERLVSTNEQIGLIALIKAFTQKSESQILGSIVKGDKQLAVKDKDYKPNLKIQTKKASGK
jgi:hypothetical protein